MFLKSLLICLFLVLLVEGQNQDQNQKVTIPSINASRGEFPHRVRVAVGKGSDISWSCGGSLISDRYVLTAGQCNGSNMGPVSAVAVDVLQSSDVSDQSKVYEVKRFIKHPDYKPPKKYNDIGLIELKESVKLNEFTAPVCLPTTDDVNNDAIATGWYMVRNIKNKDRKPTEVMQKLTLHKFTSEECSQLFTTNRHLNNGIDHNTQICFGDKELDDICVDTGGSPLQVVSKAEGCKYTVIGITSFGKGCDGTTPSVYTKVAPYVPWIKSIIAT